MTGEEQGFFELLASPKGVEDIDFETPRSRELADVADLD